MYLSVIISMAIGGYNILGLLLTQFVFSVDCTIDMNIEEFEYISKQLSMSECRRLAAALRFATYELPRTMKIAEKVIPHETTCLTLLLEWNSGTEEWMGSEKSHEIVRRRLMQMNKNWVARWLDQHVYNRLSKDLDDTLMNDLYFEVDMPPKAPSKFIQDKKELIEHALSVTGVMLWVICATMIGGMFVLVCFIMYGVYLSRSQAEKARKIELKNLLKDTFEDEEDCDDNDNDYDEEPYGSSPSARSRRKN